MTQENQWLAIGLLSAGLVFAVVLSAWLSARARRLERRLQALEGAIAPLHGEVAAVAGIGARGSERLRRLEHVADQLNDRLGQLELRGEGRPYDQAISLVRQGADSERLVSHFGLSRGEADLVALLHGRRKAG
jgi:Protein of unknown function (DUF2802)